MAALSSPTPPSTTVESASLPPFLPPSSTLQSPAKSFSNTTPSTQCSSSSVSSKSRTDKVKPPECHELAGRTTAECLAILCCCPLCIIDFTILTTCKIPVGLCRKILRKKRLSSSLKRSNKNKQNIKKKKSGNEKDVVIKKDGEDDFFCIEFSAPRIAVNDRQVVDAAKAVVESSVWPGFQPSPEMTNMDEQMRNMFFSTGFFRSMSNKKIQFTDKEEE